MLAQRHNIDNFRRTEREAFVSVVERPGMNDEPGDEAAMGRVLLRLGDVNVACLAPGGKICIAF